MGTLIIDRPQTRRPRLRPLVNGIRHEHVSIEAHANEQVLMLSPDLEYRGGRRPTATGCFTLADYAALSALGRFDLRVTWLQDGMTVRGDVLHGCLLGSPMPDTDPRFVKADISPAHIVANAS